MLCEHFVDEQSNRVEYRETDEESKAPANSRHNGVEVEEEVLVRYGDIVCQVVEPHLGKAFWQFALIEEGYLTINMPFVCNTWRVAWA